MKDQNKTKQQLIEELGKLRKQYAGLERLSNEQKLEEEKCRSLVESAVDSVYVVDKDLRYTVMNKQNLSRLGLPINKVIGKAYGEFHTKEGTAKFKKRINNVFRTCRSKTHEYRSERDGKYFLRTYSPIIGAGGKPKAVTVFSKDISALKKIEEALKKSEQELALHNKINQIFLTFPDKRIYPKLLNLILEKLESKFGTFGYFNEEGCFIIPALTREIYWEKCQMSDKDVIFERGTFSGIWARAIKEKKALYSNEGPFSYPGGHIPIENTMVAPITYKNRVISAIHIANKKTGYDDKDREFLEAMANRIAPVLSARIERDRRETKHKQMDKALQESRDYLERITNSMWDTVFSVKLPGRVINWINDSYNLIGYDPKECIGKTTEFLYPDKKEYQDFGKKLENTLAAGKDILHTEQVLKRKNGEIFPAEITTTFSKKNGKLVNVTSIVRDITERKQAEQFIRTQAEVTKNMTEGAYIVGIHDVIIRWATPRFEDMFGYEPGEIIGRHASIVNKPTDLNPIEIVDEIMEVIRRTGEWHGEVNNIKKDGTPFWCYASVSTFIHPEYGEVLLAVHTDITERKQAEEDLKKYQADLQRLSAQLINAQEDERKRISQELHDEVGQALTALKINLATIVSQFQSDIAPAMMERLAEAADLTDNLLDQIQNISLDLRPSMLDDLGLVPTLRWYIRSFEKRGNIKTQFKIVNVKGRLHPEIEISLYRIVQEALTNVVKYAEADLVNINLKAKESEIEFSIEDNGKGFDLEEVRSRPPSTHGIGLLGIQERIALLKGKTQILTQPKMGTKIIIKIPKEVRS